MAVEEIDIHESSSKSYTGLSPGWTRAHSQQLSFFILETRTRPKYSIKAEGRAFTRNLNRGIIVIPIQSYHSISIIGHLVVLPHPTWPMYQRQNWERDSYSIKKLTADSTNLQRGTNHSLATRIFISWSEIFLDSHKTRRRLRTLSLRMPLPIKFNESLRTIKSEHRIPYIDSQWMPILSDSTVSYYNTSDQTVTDPSNQINISKETNPATRPAWTKQEGANYPSITSLRISITGISPA